MSENLIASFAMPRFQSELLISTKKNSTVGYVNRVGMTETTVQKQISKALCPNFS